MQLPHSKTLKQIIKDCSEKAGIDDEYLYGQHKAYVKFQKEREEKGHPRPLGVGVMMWDEVKVRISILHSVSSLIKVQNHTHVHLMGLKMVLQLFLFCNKISSKPTVKLRKG